MTETLQPIRVELYNTCYFRTSQKEHQILAFLHVILQISGS